MTYTKMGHLTVVPAADLISLTSAANAQRGTNVTNQATGPIGKSAAMVVIRDSGTPGATQYSMVFARGPLPGDLWSNVDGSVSYTPV